MAQLRLAQLRDNPLFRATTIVLTFLVLVTAVTFFMPRQFADASTGEVKPALVTAPWSAPKVAERPKDLVTATFDVLKPKLGEVPAKRIVQTVAVSPTGTLPDSIPAPEPLTPEALADAAAAPASSSEPVEVADAVAQTPAVETNVNSLTALESVNVRSGPNKSNDRVFLLVAGESVTVSEMYKGWLHVTDNKNREGWAYGESFDASAVAAVTVPEATDVAVASDSGVEVATETDVAPPAAGTAKVLGQGVTVRSGPGKTNAALFALSGGSVVTVGENQRGWLKITDAKGRTGWAYKDYLALS